MVIVEAIEKIWQIDDHVGATGAGILSDARVLIERSQLKAQQHKLTYDSPIDILTIVKDICDLKQICTQSGGLRPFGVSLLIAGIDQSGPKLYETDPTGIFFQFKATAIGEHEPEIVEILNKKYKETITIEEALKMCIEALSKIIRDKFNAERIDTAYIRSDENQFKKFSREKLEKVLKEVKKK